MLAASQALASLAILSVGVIYGTDMFSALVLRPAMPAPHPRSPSYANGNGQPIPKCLDRQLPLQITPDFA
jgi:hypothetical protein